MKRKYGGASFALTLSVLVAVLAAVLGAGVGGWHLLQLLVKH